jgi:ERCC4-type nuclease
MITVDNRSGFGREGPAGFIGLLGRCGLTVQPGRLQYGDIRFLGSGPEGAPVTIGIECKSIHDILHCITDGRFAGHQLPGLQQAYDQAWLLVEGQWRAERKSGMLQYLSRSYQWRDASVGSRKFMYRDLLAWLHTIRIKTGVLMETVPDWEHAATWVASLHTWWTRTKRIGGEEVTGWESHRSHLAVNQASNEQFWARVKQEERERERERERKRIKEAQNGTNGNGSTNRVRPHSLTDPANLLRPTVCRMVAAQLPGVGYSRSEEVAKAFPTVASLVAATEKELMAVEGIGKEGARKIWRALHS